MRIPQTDRFETTLPKEHFFNSPRTKKQSKQTDWHAVIITGIVAVTFIAAVKQIVTHQPAATPAPAPAVVAPHKEVKPEDFGFIPVPTPLPEVRRATPVPVPVPSTPRAQLVHLRPIGTYEYDQMPDGRTLQTLYKGELPSAANLPRSGGQPGDMWFTRNDGHTWVLAPIAGGSQTVGWIDP
jgi:hypothetical protein